MYDSKMLESRLQMMIGAALSGAHRASDMPTFSFRARSGNVYSLHLSCPWQLVDPDGIITGNLDVYEPAAVDSDFDWRTWYAGEWERFDGRNRYDHQIQNLLRSTSDRDRTVTRAQASSCGDCTVSFDNEMELRVYVCGSARHREMWRFFEKGKPHLVIHGGDGQRFTGGERGHSTFYEK
jgi:hypothetical protein